MNIFYDNVLKVITRTVYRKMSDTTDALRTLIDAIDRKNQIVFAKKDYVDGRFSDLVSQMNKDKNQLNKKIKDLADSSATVSAMMSLAEGINQRLDNAYEAITSSTTTVTTELSTLLESTVGGILTQVNKNASDIAELKGTIENLIPQIVNAIDTDTLNQLIESVIASELAKNGLANNGGITEENIDEVIDQVVDDALADSCGTTVVDSTQTDGSIDELIEISVDPVPTPVDNPPSDATPLHADIHFPSSRPEDIDGNLMAGTYSEGNVMYKLVVYPVGSRVPVDCLVNYDQIDRPYINIPMSGNSMDIVIVMNLYYNEAKIYGQEVCTINNVIEGEYTGTLAPINRNIDDIIDNYISNFQFTDLSA